jgi:ribonucleoside-diphosphate reductase alpha chain
MHLKPRTPQPEVERSKTPTPPVVPPPATPNSPNGANHTNGINGTNGGAPRGSTAVAASVAERIRLARQKGYEGDPCSKCGQLTLVRSGACLRCDSCGETSGCG